MKIDWRVFIFSLMILGEFLFRAIISVTILYTLSTQGVLKGSMGGWSIVEWAIMVSNFVWIITPFFYGNIHNFCKEVEDGRRRKETKV